MKRGQRHEGLSARAVGSRGVGSRGVGSWGWTLCQGTSVSRTLTQEPQRPRPRDTHAGPGQGRWAPRATLAHLPNAGDEPGSPSPGVECLVECASHRARGPDPEPDDALGMKSATLVTPQMRRRRPQKARGLASVTRPVAYENQRPDTKLPPEIPKFVPGTNPFKGFFPACWPLVLSTASFLESRQHPCSLCRPGTK